MQEFKRRVRATRPAKPAFGAMAMRKSTRDEMREKN
jgi:hypothetical protein